VGTILNDTCYYGNSTCKGEPICSQNGCTIIAAKMYLNDSCNKTTGPQDTKGPVISNISVLPEENHGVFNISAIVYDNGSSIKAAEYFLGLGNATENCGVHGNGTLITPADDGIFNQDRRIENVSALNVTFRFDGINKVCLQAQDSSGNWGNCTCKEFSVDATAPEAAQNISLNNNSNYADLMVCNTTPILKATVCDSVSGVKSAQYFLDAVNFTQALSESSFWYTLERLNNYTNKDSKNCSDFSGQINLTALSEGMHSLSFIRGIDFAGNIRNITNQSLNYSFIKDTLPPRTTMAISPNETNGDCNYKSANGSTLEGCFLVINGSTIMLNASDQDLQSDGKVSGSAKIHYKLWMKIDNNWTFIEEKVSESNGTINLTVNTSNIRIEYWSEDACKWIENHHYDLAIANASDYKSDCGDSVCASGETSTTCLIDCPSPVIVTKPIGSSHSSGSGGGGWVAVNSTSQVNNSTEILGSLIESDAACESEWICADWENCTEGLQQRTCVDVYNCTLQKNTPNMIQPCSVDSVEEINLAVCGDGNCERDKGENEVNCPQDCGSVNIDNRNRAQTMPTGNFLESTSGVLEGILVLIIVAIIYKLYKNRQKVSALKKR